MEAISNAMREAGGYWWFACLHNLKSPEENAEIIYLAMIDAAAREAGRVVSPDEEPTPAMNAAGGVAWLATLDDETSDQHTSACTIYHAMRAHRPSVA